METNIKITQQRDAFFDRLYEIAKEDKDVYLISADMSAPSLDKFRKDLMNQYINVGIAEQNAIEVGAGMALEGKKIFVYGIASFISLRCIEQIRIECAIMSIPLTIIAVGVGLGYEDSGPTHHMIEDISVLRTFPNIIINNTTDSIIASAVADLSYIYKRYGLSNYVRLDRSTKHDIYDKDANFSNGYNILKEGKNYILATGIMVRQAQEIINEIDDLGLIDVHSIPCDNSLINIISNKNIITMEEHILDGGFGSYILELLNKNNIKTNVFRIGIDKKYGYCYTYGGRETGLWKYYNIDKESSIKNIKEFLNK